MTHIHADTARLPGGHQAAGDRPRVLLAEDDPISRAVIAHQLRRLGYRCTLAEDGEEAWQRLAGHGIDLVLTDCRMPVLDGYALARRIRASERAGAHLPIVALSASDPLELAQRCAESGMDGVLEKPVRLQALAHELHRHLGQQDAVAAGPDRLDVLAEAFGSLDDARAVLATLLAACRRDLDALEAALRRGDAATCRDLAHRIDGSLRLVEVAGSGPVPPPAGDQAAQARSLRRRVARLACLLDGLGAGTEPPRGSG